jgi:phage N-6-adenine-methyltransferase
MSLSRSLLTSINQDWATPIELFKSLDRIFGFDLDGCAVAATAKCRKFVGPDNDGLNHSWRGRRVFCNPPYSGLDSWMPKARNESIEAPSLSVSLVPYRPDPEWFAVGALSEDGAAGRLVSSYYDPTNRVMWLRWRKLITGIHAIKGRIPFGGPTKSKKPTPAPFPSAIVIHASLGLKPRLREGVASMWPTR